MWAEGLPPPGHLYPVQRLGREAGSIYKRLVQIYCGRSHPLPYMREELAKAWEQARSIESKPEGSQAEEIGREKAGDKMFVFYQDENKNFWYRTQFLHQGEWVSEYEHVFGKKKGRKRK